MAEIPTTFPRWLRNCVLFPLWFLNGWLLVIFLNYLQPMFNIAIISIILALLLEFPVQFLQRLGLKRSWSLILVLLVGLLLVLGLGLLLIPSLFDQLQEFIKLLPQWIGSANEQLDYFKSLPMLRGASTAIENLESQLNSQLSKIAGGLANGLVGLLLQGFSGGLNLFFVVVLTIFMLIGGQPAWEGLLRWLPPWWSEKLSKQVPVKMRTFLGGQVIIAVGFSVTLVIIFTIIGIPFGLLFGILIGMASMVPFMGAIVQTSVSLFLMLQDFSVGLQVLVVALVLGQIVDQVIVPRVMGGLVGVNPIWLLVAVFIGAKFAGIVGVLLSVPASSVIKSIAEDWWQERQFEQRIPPGHN